MVKPLYLKRKPEPKPEPPLWKNPSLLLEGLGVLSLVLVVILQFTTKKALDPAATTPGSETSKKSSWFSFLRPSMLFKQDTLDIIAEREREELDLSSGTTPALSQMKAENFREKRRLYAFQKLEGAQQIARERIQDKEDFYRRREAPEAQNLKDALSALEDSDNLGIMKLESLLNDALLKRGGKSENLDILVFAFQNLGDTYTRKNMKKQAKNAYINAFKLMKEKAPSEEGAQWDSVIAEVEKLDATSLGN